MMHTATDLLKFRRLARRLRSVVDCVAVSAETIVVGLLERLWHAAAREARDGRIGAKFSDDDIAELIGWTGETAVVIEALVAERWLDRSAEGVLCVHDWDDHKPNWLRGVDGRRRSAVSDIFEPGADLGQILSNQPSYEPGKQPGYQPSHQPSTLLPNLTKPNQTQPNQTKPNQPAAAASLPMAAAARFDFSRFADTPDHREAARLGAEKLFKAAGKVIDRDKIWQVAWISEGINRGWCSEMFDKLRGGGVKNYRRYVERALDGELSKVGLTFEVAVAAVPGLKQSQAKCEV